MPTIWTGYGSQIAEIDEESQSSVVNKVIVDSGFWYALYDPRDQYSQLFRPFAEQL